MFILSVIFIIIITEKARTKECGLLSRFRGGKQNLNRF